MTIVEYKWKEMKHVESFVVRVFMDNSVRTKHITMSFDPVLSEQTAVNSICCIASHVLNIRFKRHLRINNFRQFLHKENQNRRGM
jgi:uncharacterized protein YbaA (DUF1428 family)